MELVAAKDERVLKHYWTSGRVLALLLLGDGILIAADLLQRQRMLDDIRFLITHDRGYGEMFQYAKAAFACLLLLRAGLRRSSLAAFTWASLLALVLLDDALKLHERAGEILDPLLGLRSIGALRANQVGELMFYAVLGTACLAGLAIAWRRGDASDRALSRRLFPPFAALGFCAVVLDAVASLTRRTSWGVELALLEDGGEMVVLSFLTVTAWRVVARTSSQAPR